MVIIGKTKDGFVITATEEEVAQLAGFYSNYSDGFKGCGVGTGLPIGNIYQRATETISAYENIKNNMNGVRGAITKLLKNMEPEAKEAE